MFVVQAHQLKPPGLRRYLKMTHSLVLHRTNSNAKLFPSHSHFQEKNCYRSDKLLDSCGLCGKNNFSADFHSLFDSLSGKLLCKAVLMATMGCSHLTT